MASRTTAPRSFNTVRRSHREERIRRQKNSRIVLLAICCILLLLLLVSIVFLFFHVAHLISDRSQTKAVVFESSFVYTGEFSGAYPNDADLKFLKEVRSSLGDGTPAYDCPGTVRLRPIAASELNRLLTDCAAETGSVKTSVAKGYDQENGLQSGYAAQLQSTAGGSPEKAVKSFISQNAERYGFLAFEENDTLRLEYVGIAHAAYMMKEELSKDEYLNKVKNLSDGGYFQITAKDGAVYRIYYIRLSGSAETATVRIPDAPYTVSGDGSKSGLILAVKISE